MAADFEKRAAEPCAAPGMALHEEACKAASAGVSVGK